MKLDENSVKISIDSLPDEHQKTFLNALAKVLSSPVVETTYAQIIDGLPISDVALDVYGELICPGHPLLDERLELSDEVLRQTRYMRRDFDPLSLRWEPEVSISEISAML